MAEDRNIMSYAKAFKGALQSYMDRLLSDMKALENFDAVEFIEGSARKMTEEKKALIDKWFSESLKADEIRKLENVYAVINGVEYYPRFHFDAIYDGLGTVPEAVSRLFEDDDKLSLLRYADTEEGRELDRKVGEIYRKSFTEENDYALGSTRYRWIDEKVEA